MTKSFLFIQSAVVTVAVGVAACDEPGGRGGQQAGDATTSVTDTTTSTTSGPDATTTLDTSSGEPILVDPRCVDGQYDEVFPDETADISGLMAGYSQANARNFVDDVLGVRYPTGQYLVREGVLRGTDFGNCIDIFARNTSTARGVIDDLSTVVHECGHLADIYSDGFSTSTYLITPELSFECPNAAARAGKTFARSLLNGDEFAALLPDDFYRDTYLDGDPTDGTFDGGDQGYDSVLEEATQYVNSLVVDWVFSDQRSSFGSVSARDGILTFLWYIERYLRMARLEYPSAYQLITGNACWREATLTVWGRAWLYLELTAGDSGLGISDDVIEPLVKDPELLGEITRLRQAAGCP